jgi:hypothetical protein
MAWQKNKRKKEERATSITAKKKPDIFPLSLSDNAMIGLDLV